jgi:hypothetical protein
LGFAALALYLQAVFVGVAMFVLNLIAKRGVGVVAGLLLAFLPAVAQVVYVPRVYYFTPTAWANLTVLDLSGTSARPSLAFALSTLTGLIAVLGAVAMLLYKKREIEVLMPL